MPSAESRALALVTKSAPVHFSPSKPTLLLKKLEAIDRAESQAVFLALQVGVLLWQIKAQIKHGEFKGWIAEHVSGRSYRSCAYYMKLALAFVEKAKPSEAVVQALPGLDLDASKLKPTDTSAREAMEKFAGGRSLTELLIKHGIKGVGLKAELTEGEAPPPVTAGEQLELLWEQAYQPAKSLADLLVERAAVLTPDKREAIVAELTRALQALRAC